MFLEIHCQKPLFPDQLHIGPTKTNTNIRTLVHSVIQVANKGDNWDCKERQHD
jgi:hypothetical protein